MKKKTCSECGGKVSLFARWFGITICEECDSKPLMQEIERLESLNKESKERLEALK